jgi:transmembrane sensor
MTDSRECPCGQSRVRDEAAQWFVRLQNPVMDVEERQRFDAWLAEHPNHRDEIQLLQGIWSATDLLPKERLQALCERPAERAKRRPLLRFAVAAGLLAVAVGLGLFSGLDAAGDYSGEFATALGERSTSTAVAACVSISLITNVGWNWSRARRCSALSMTRGVRSPWTRAAAR